MKENFKSYKGARLGRYRILLLNASVSVSPLQLGAMKHPLTSSTSSIFTVAPTMLFTDSFIVENSEEWLD